MRQLKNIPIPKEVTPEVSMYLKLLRDEIEEMRTEINKLVRLMNTVIKRG